MTATLHNGAVAVNRDIWFPFQTWPTVPRLCFLPCTQSQGFTRLHGLFSINLDESRFTTWFPKAFKTIDTNVRLKQGSTVAHL